MVYAVRKGIVTGKFYSWEECKLSVLGVSCAEYKGFDTDSEADDYLEHRNQSTQKICTETGCVVEKATNEIRVRGTFNPDLKCYAYGAVLTVGEEKVKLYGSGSKQEYLPSKQIAGEIQGVLDAIKEAIKRNLNSVTVVYKSQFLEKVATGEWSTSNICVMDYAIGILEYKKSIDIRFRKSLDEDYKPYTSDLSILSKRAISCRSGF